MEEVRVGRSDFRDEAVEHGYDALRSFRRCDKTRHGARRVFVDVHLVPNDELDTRARFSALPHHKQLLHHRHTAVREVVDIGFERNYT